MAYVALASTQLVFRGASGKMYRVGIAKDTAVGFATNSWNSQTFWVPPEDVTLVDAFVGDSVNAGDYLDIYLDGIVRPPLRLYLKAINAATTVPRIAGWAPIKKGTQVNFYHYSA